MDKKEGVLPELLAPAGNMSALVSAIASGADAVYFGADLFNARIRANNFTLDEAKEAIKLCHAHGVKAFVTLNVAIYDREMPKMLEYVSSLYESGVDALIVADLGAMTLIKERFPDLELHASTQASVHNLDGVKEMAELGCKRVVVARELDKENLEYICKNTDREIEMFVHGAHCVSMSGQCLMSYAMGGRSGNRGECAQPCRLPYERNGVSSYHLSLKDMSLANHVEEILKIGASSLKIEGRMKGEEYVGGVVAEWRKLLDNAKNATRVEIEALAKLFSRQGFTDGYFEKRVDKSMLGIRTEENKAQTKEQEVKEYTLKKPPVKLFARLISGERAELTATLGEKSVTVLGDVVEEAISAPMSKEDIEKSLSKLGSTPLSLGSVEIEKSENIMVRVSALNALRRQAIDKLLIGERKAENVDYVAKKREKTGEKIRSAVFELPTQVPYNANEYFDRIFLPFFMYDCGLANGIYLPPIILDDEWKDVEEILKSAKDMGAKYLLVTNIGQLRIAKKMGFIPVADLRFNVFNGHSIDYLEKQGFDDIVLSPELTLPQARDMSGYSLIVYGKIPVMTTFKCLWKDATNCKKCSGYITDRTGAKMFADCLYGHHTVIHNSVPIYMADKQEQIDSHSWFFIFTDESEEDCAGIIESYRYGIPTNERIRRIAK